MKEIKTISIQCDSEEKLDRLNIAEMTEFQGGLKARTDIDYDKIKLSIIKYGFSFPFFIWKSDKNYLLDGHGRFNTLCKMQKDGYIIPDLPVVYIEAKDEKEAKQKLLRLNSQYGKMTKESVLEFADDLEINFEEIALPDTVIDFSDGAEETEEEIETKGDEEIPEEQEEIVSKYGEMYELGNSILMCGDSTKAEDVERLMNGEKADLVFTDPPYNMSVHMQGFSEERMKKRLENIIDFDPYTIKDVMLGLDVNNFYIFTSKNLIPQYFEIFKGYDFNILVWCKDNPTPMTNYTFLPDIEYLLYFHKKGGVWNNGLDVSLYKKYYNGNKMEGRKEAGDVHPTIKPVKIIEDKILISSNKNGLVLDLFGGSGSTLIACEKTNRKARIMELDPKYCDVIRRRYTQWCLANNRPLTSGCLE